MPSISRIIQLMVLFIVGFVIFMIIKNVRLPFLKVFVYDLNSDLLVRIWWYIKAFLIILFGWITMFMVLLYFIWLFIRKVVPWPIKPILLKVPPLPQLQRAGVFDFLGRLFGIIFSRLPLGTRIVRALSAFGIFVQQNTNMLMQEMGVVPPGQAVQQATITTQPTNSPSTETDTSDRKTEFNVSESRQLDDALQQCLEENLIPISTDMTPNERRSANAKNQSIIIQCRGKNLEAMEKYRAFG